MEFKQEPIPNQKFEMGRVITLTKCGTMECCTGCDFMHCGNYAKRMRQVKYKKEDFFEEYKNELVSINKPLLVGCNFFNDYPFRVSYLLVSEMLDNLDFHFPANTYWNLDYYFHPEDQPIDDWFVRSIELQKISRKGEEITLGRVDVSDHRIFEYDFTDAQYKLAEKIRDILLWLKQQTYEAICKEVEKEKHNEKN